MANYGSRLSKHDLPTSPPPADEQREVASLALQLMNGMDRLDEAVDALLRRIEPVLTPETPSTGVSTAQETRTEMGACLNLVVERMQVLADALFDAERRAQL